MNRERLLCAALAVLSAGIRPLYGAEPAGEVPFQMIVPGFTVRELPVSLTSLNNIEYASDGRLFAGGYDGRFHVLRDTDGDGLEDKVDTISPETSSNYPLGVSVKDGVPYFVLSNAIIRFVDSDGDGIPETREIVAKGFDDPALQGLPYLHSRRVDSSMGLAHGPDGSLYVTMGNAGFANPYWHDGIAAGGDVVTQPAGDVQYSPDKRRGCLLRITAEGQVQQLASGLRYIMSLQFDKHGELFATDQEGATWSPNGNPYDELLHIQTGRHYGFPPRHPRWLPGVIDEPSVWDYTPQHQSTCGFRFNGPLPGHGRVGPTFWADDALVTGASRGKLWRTSIVKTDAGYVATNQLVGSSSLMIVDCAISPKGDLLVACHPGAPDWGNGPNGEGRLFKISTDSGSVARPVFCWPRSETETVVAFDGPVDPQAWSDVSRQIWVEAGRYVRAADRLETIRPGYAVVRMQQRQLRKTIPVASAEVGKDGHQLVIKTEPRTAAVHYALALPQGMHLDHDLSGVAAEWRGADGARWEGWLPHPDLAAARHFTRGSGSHDALWTAMESAGELTLRGKLDLSRMLIPDTQPLSRLDYTPEPETVTVSFRSDGELSLDVPGAEVERVSENESRMTVVGPSADKGSAFSLTLSTPATRLNVSFHIAGEPRERALHTKRFLMPFAQTAPPDVESREIPQIAGGDYEAGRELFGGKAACAQCHQFRGVGFRVGADLGNLFHRDYDSVLRDILQPNATINPDAIQYTVSMVDGKQLTGTRIDETADELHLGIPGKEPAVVQKSEIDEVRPSSVSMMPTGIEKLLNEEELRDLMTYLMTERRSRRR